MEVSRIKLRRMPKALILSNKEDKSFWVFRSQVDFFRSLSVDFVSQKGFLLPFLFYPVMIGFWRSSLPQPGSIERVCYFSLRSALFTADADRHSLSGITPAAHLTQFAPSIYNSTAICMLWPQKMSPLPPARPEAFSMRPAPSTATLMPGKRWKCMAKKSSLKKM